MHVKQKQLENIARAIERCQECKAGKIGKAVPGEGNANANVIFIGEAPGRLEAASGRPFIGRSGQLLRGLIRDSGLAEKDVFITSPVKYLPKRGTPSQKDIDHGRMHLFTQLDVIAPEIIVLLGSTACNAVLEEKRHVLKEHGTVVVKGGRKYLITIHPAAVLRFPKYKPFILSDFKKLRSLG